VFRHWGTCKSDVGFPLMSLNAITAHLTTPWTDFDFLGFRFSREGVSIRDKSVEKFKDRVRALTRRHHNFGLEAIRTLNRVITGFARTSRDRSPPSARSLINWTRGFGGACAA